MRFSLIGLILFEYAAQHTAKRPQSKAWNTDLPSWLSEWDSKLKDPTDRLIQFGPMKKIINKSHQHGEYPRIALLRMLELIFTYLTLK